MPPMSTSAFSTILGYDLQIKRLVDLKIKDLVIGRRSSTRTTLQKPKRLLITHFKLENPFSVCTVYAGRTASIAGIGCALSLSAAQKGKSSSGMACLLTSMKGRRLKTSCVATKPILRKLRG